MSPFLSGYIKFLQFGSFHITKQVVYSVHDSSTKQDCSRRHPCFYSIRKTKERCPVKKETNMSGQINTKTGLRGINKTRWLTITALFMALNIAMSGFGIPVPGGHLYLCDIVICTAAMLLDPAAAFFVGGVGSFLGDLIFYPAPMFVSLVTHGAQAFVIALFARKGEKLGGKNFFLFSLFGSLIGAVIMVTGYTLGKTYIYATFEYAMIKLPYEIAQGLLGVIGGLLLVFRAGLARILHRFGPY